MIRFIVPVLVLTAIFWFTIYAVTHPEKRKGLRIFRQLGIAVLLAILSLTVVSIVVYFLGDM